MKFLGILMDPLNLKVHLAVVLFSREILLISIKILVLNLRP